jgi:hypothetical protein
MPVQEFLEVREGTCWARAQGEASLVEAVEFVRRSIEYCRRRSIVKLLVDGIDLVGVPIPTLVDRFLAVEEWATEADGMVIVVLVVQAPYIHPEKFGVKVATHLGLTANVFTSEHEAQAWLASFALPA